MLLDNTMLWVAIILHMQVSCRREKRLGADMCSSTVKVGDYNYTHVMKQSTLLDYTMLRVEIIVNMQVSCHWEKNNWALIRVVILLKWATISIHM
jgi:hypothetical protein